MTIGLLIAAALAASTLSVAAAWRRPRLWLFSTMSSAAAFLGASLLALGGSLDWQWRSGVAVAGEIASLRLDGLSAWFLALLAVVGGVGAGYAWEYWPGTKRPGADGRGRAWWSILVTSMALVLLSANGLHFLIAWEIFALSGYFLITLERDRKEARGSGFLYLAASHAGTMGLLAFFSLLAARTGSWELGPMGERIELAPLFWLALFGFGVKAGVVPLHVWLPSAHATAPSHVSAILSGVAIKMGLYGVLRFSGWLPTPPGAGLVVLSLGVVSAVLGAVLALAQNDLKRLLAYCSVEHMGLIWIGLGAGILGVRSGNAAFGELALAGALLHVWNHGLIKSLLFLGAGSVLHATGTREMSRLGGLWRAMPWTAAAFAFGSAAISALPPLNGFVSEWLIYLGLLRGAAGHVSASGAAFPAAIALALAGALSLAAFLKASAVVFLGAPRTRAALDAAECGPWMRIAMATLAGLSTLLALAPAGAGRLLPHPLQAWASASSGGGAELPAPLGALGIINAALFAALGLATAWLWRRAGAEAAPRTPTWDCGYSAPTARMQYTSGSFSALATEWFRPVLGSPWRIRRPRGPFPKAADVMPRVSEPVLDRVVEPASRLVMAASAWMRMRQHGRLQAYILYLVAALSGVGAMIVWMGAR
jgi:hydrogenase-4 component B